MSLRVVANVGQDHLTTTIGESAGDRHVRSGVYVPSKVPTGVLHLRQKKLGLAWAKSLVHAYLAPGETARSYSADSTGEKLLTDGNPLARIASVADETAVADIVNRKSRGPQYSNKQKDIVEKLLQDLSAAQENDEAAELIARFMTVGKFAAINALARQNWTATASNLIAAPDFWMVISGVLGAGRSYGPPHGLPDDTSDIGYLFIDRTRIRPTGFSLGEHLYATGLAPGEELVLEQKSYRKRIETFEQSLEREFERELESESEQTQTIDTGETDQTDIDQGLHIGQSGSVGGQLPEIPISAELGLDAAQDFSQAVSVSEERSVTTSATATNRISSKLRSLHKTSFKVTNELSLETSSRRMIRNPNPNTSVTLHYFKVMQQLQMQQQRSGARLCWAPFVHDPGAGLRWRMQMARQKVLVDAIRRLELPVPPSRPEPTMAPEWVSGLEEFFVAPLGNIPFTTGVYLGVKDLYVPLPADSTFTGNVRAKMRGPAITRSSVSVREWDVDDATHRDEEEERQVQREVAVNIGPAVNINDLINPSGVFVKLEAEVLRELPGYEANLEQYHQQMDDWRREVAALKNAAVQEAEPKAEAAARRVLATTDPRDELLTSVVQMIHPSARDEAREVEFWRRIIDFENIGYTLYPGWWQGDLRMPEYPADHLLNASWARVYLPVRMLPSRLAGSPTTNEEKLLYQLFRPDVNPGLTTAAFNSMAEELIQKLKELQSDFIDDDGLPVVQDIGKSWTESVPTDGTHVEAVVGATTAADPQVERRFAAETESLEAERDAIVKENAIRDRAADPVSASIVIGDE